MLLLLEKADKMQQQGSWNVCFLALNKQSEDLIIWPNWSDIDLENQSSYKILPNFDKDFNIPENGSEIESPIGRINIMY